MIQPGRKIRDVLEEFDWRLSGIEHRLATRRWLDDAGQMIVLEGSTWHISGQEMAVWTTGTLRPLSWTQGQWARLRAGKIEARGGFDFRSGSSGARIVFTDDALIIYDSSDIVQVQAGNLAGVTDPKYGALSGWGLYSYSQAYFNTLEVWTIELYGGGAIYGAPSDFISYSPINDEWWFMIGGLQKLVVGADKIIAKKDFQVDGDYFGTIKGGQF